MYNTENKQCGKGDYMSDKIVTKSGLTPYAFSTGHVQSADGISLKDNARYSVDLKFDGNIFCISSYDENGLISNQTKDSLVAARDLWRNTLKSLLGDTLREVKFDKRFTVEFDIKELDRGCAPWVVKFNNKPVRGAQTEEQAYLFVKDYANENNIKLEKTKLTQTLGL